MHTPPTQRPHGDTLAQRRAPMKETRPGDLPPGLSLCPQAGAAPAPIIRAGALEERRAGGKLSREKIVIS